jgi:acyl-coenzyme A synthetase/AMP-(fatty) acid ligase
VSGWKVPPGYRVYPPEVNFCREVLERPIEQGGSDRAALRFDGGEWSYAQLADEVGRFARNLQRMGVARGARVLFRSPNAPRQCAALLAALKLGAVPVLTNSLLKAEELDYIQENSEARFAVTTGALAMPLEDLKRRGRIDAIHLLEADKETQGPVPVTADTGALEPALLFYSSGTTGRPKGIIHGHKWIFAMGDVIRLQMEYQPGDVVMTPGEYSFMATFGHCLMAPLASGATVALFSGRPSPDTVLRAIEQFRVTKFMSVPTFYRTVLAQHEVAAKYDVSGVRIWVSGGEALGATPQEQWQRIFGRPLYDMYGITEAEVLIGNGPAHPPKPGSIGRAFPALRLALLDDELREVPAGAPGRLMVHRSDPGMFLGYQRQWDKWRSAHRGDWYDTGDVMIRDDDGCFWYQGRQDDLFKTRGMFVSPQEIENLLLRHPSVAEAAVTGAPDERIGNRVCAFVVLKAHESPSETLVAALRDTVAGQLADYKVPQEVRFLPQLPKSVVGKIMRRQLPV